jgi:hypothetical protein
VGAKELGKHRPHSEFRGSNAGIARHGHKTVITLVGEEDAQTGAVGTGIRPLAWGCRLAIESRQRKALNTAGALVSRAVFARVGLVMAR